ncbi:MAG TPA: C39 family peptidase [Nocardioides sp.]|nr:C39 family peptidase [Nocardioides sp.]
MTRARWIGLGTVALLLAMLPLAPLLPHGGGDGGTARRAAGPAGAAPLVAGWGHLTPGYRRTIDHVVGDALTAPRVAPTASPRALADSLVRCATFEGQRYCLGQGWTDHTQAQVQRRTARVAARQAARPALARTTGDLSTLDALRAAARMTPQQRADAERAELRQAARSVAKVWLLRHQVEGVPLPQGFLARHPEVRPEVRPDVRPEVRPTTTTSTTTTSGRIATVQTSGRSRAKHWRDYPKRGTVLDHHDVSAQRRTYWCGPTTMQMITWGWSGNRRPQRHWAHRLGTTTDGTSITSMVHVVNRYTGWDKASHAGPYITLDISDWSFRKWILLMARHTVDYRAPVVLHPILLKRYYPYLDHDGSGHFQVGRGYKKRGDKTPLLGYFEPWNQQRFYPDEPYISRVQWRSAYRSYRANRAHFQHNLGV